MASIEIEAAGAADPHPAAPGDELVIRLAETPSSGYRWHIDAYDSTVLTPAGVAFASTPDAETGGGGTREFRFVVETADRSDLALSLRRAWETDRDAAQRFQTAIN